MDKQATRNVRPLGLPNERGMTLIEIIVVITIIGILMAWLVGSIFKTAGQAKAGISEGKMKQAMATIALYQLKFNKLPSDLKSAGIDDDTDAWGQTLQFQVIDGGRRYEIRSLGADGKAGGTAGDADITVAGP